MPSQLKSLESQLFIQKNGHNLYTQLQTILGPNYIEIALTGLAAAQNHAKELAQSNPAPRTPDHAWYNQDKASLYQDTPIPTNKIHSKLGQLIRSKFVEKNAKTEETKVQWENSDTLTKLIDTKASKYLQRQTCDT